jgi:hypothetical protein
LVITFVSFSQIPFSRAPVDGLRNYADKAVDGRPQTEFMAIVLEV